MGELNRRLGRLEREYRRRGPRQVRDDPRLQEILDAGRARWEAVRAAEDAYLAARRDNHPDPLDVAEAAYLRAAGL